MAEVIGRERQGNAKLWLTVFCWVMGVANIIIGLTNVLGTADRHIPVGLIRLVGGIILLPPILKLIEQHFPFVRRARAILLFAFIVLPILGLSTGYRPKLEPLPTSAEKLPAAGSPTTAPAQAPLPTRGLPTPAILKAAPRFMEVPAGHMLRPVQDALNAGNIDGAFQLLADRNAVAENDQPMKARLMDALQRASDEQIGRDPGADYAERIDSYWLPQVRALPSIAPADPEAFGRVRTQLDGTLVAIDDGSRIILSKASAAKHQQLKTALAAKQRTLFPSMRKNYAATLDAKLFRHDVRVAAIGPGNSTLLLTGGMFSFNAKIEDTQNEIGPAAASLRFKKVSYRWSQHIDERTTYDLDAPADTAIVR